MRHTAIFIIALLMAGGVSAQVDRDAYETRKKQMQEQYARQRQQTSQQYGEARRKAQQEYAGLRGNGCRERCMRSTMWTAPASVGTRGTT